MENQNREEKMNTVRMGTDVRVRFAPSPTGDLHIGGVRTALFNWLYARNRGGKFLVRIEDSDMARSTKEASNVILEGLHWLGLDSDEETVFQSHRIERHQSVLAQLLKEDKAYYCDCTPEMLAEKRERALKEGGKPKYDGRCRDRGLGSEGNALRFRAPQQGEITFHDVIRGKVTFQNDELDDLIICRSNKTPTYNFLVVVDDSDMKISHVIRGEDHINNTPRQIAIYHALGADVPCFAHLPMILGPDKSLLSKRHGATSILEYKNQGYLPAGLLNYIARLGWGHGDQEIFSIAELVRYFDLSRINKAAAVFDIEKLQWVNSQHLKSSDVHELTQLLPEFLQYHGYNVPEDYPLDEVVHLFLDRSKTLQEVAEKAYFLFEEPQDFDPKGAKKFLRPVMIEPFEAIMNHFRKMEVFDHVSIQKCLEDFLVQKDWKLGKIAQPIRLAVTGQTVSPGIYEVLAALGQEKVLHRMDSALDYMRRRAAQ